MLSSVAGNEGATHGSVCAHSTQSCSQITQRALSRSLDPLWGQIYLGRCLGSQETPREQSWLERQRKGECKCRGWGGVGQGLGQDESQHGTWKDTEGDCREQGVGAVVVVSIKGYLSTKSHLKLASNNWRPTLNQIADIRWIIEKANKFQKNIYFCLIDYATFCDCGSQQTLENWDGNTRPPDPPPEKSLCRSRSNS